MGADAVAPLQQLLPLLASNGGRKVVKQAFITCGGGGSKSATGGGAGGSSTRPTVERLTFPAQLGAPAGGGAPTTPRSDSARAPVASSPVAPAGPPQAISLHVYRGRGVASPGPSAVTVSVLTPPAAGARAELAAALSAAAPLIVASAMPAPASSGAGAAPSDGAAVAQAVAAVAMWACAGSAVTPSPPAVDAAAGTLVWDARLAHSLSPACVLLLHLAGGGSCVLLPEWYGLGPGSSLTVPNPGWARLSGAGSAAILVRVAAGGALEPKAPETPRPAAVAAAPLVLPHRHTLYCDRKRAVCTGEGAVREGNTLVQWGGTSWDAPAPGAGPSAQQGRAAWLLPPSLPTGSSVTWYASEAVAAGGHAPSLRARAGAVPWATPPPSYDDEGSGLAMLPLPPTPPFVLPSVPGLALGPETASPPLVMDSILASMGAAAAGAADSPLYSSAAAQRLLRAEEEAAAGNALALPLSLSHIGRRIAVLVIAGGRAHLSAATGVVEAAPPRVREVWVDGEAAVGGELRARVLYYGGRPGPCDFSWVRVDGEGRRSESSPVSALPSGPWTGPGPDPRTRTLTAEDVGCSFKVTCEPVRADGVRGAPSTSKPTAEAFTGGA